MSTTNDLHQLEKQMYASYHQDGILELLVGLALLMFGTFAIADLPYLAGLVFLVYLFYKPAKQNITLPRLGHVRFAPEQQKKRQTKVQALLWMTVISGLLTFAMVTSTILGKGFNLISQNVPLIFGLVLAAVAVFGAGQTGIRRWYGYAAAALLAFGTLNFTGGHIGIPFIVLAAVILLAGGFVLAGFLRRYPGAGE